MYLSFVIRNVVHNDAVTPGERSARVAAPQCRLTFPIRFALIWNWAAIYIGILQLDDPSSIASEGGLVHLQDFLGLTAHSSLGDSAQGCCTNVALLPTQTLRN
jgi:hypothetical protein